MLNSRGEFYCCYFWLFTTLGASLWNNYGGQIFGRMETRPYIDVTIMYLMYTRRKKWMTGVFVSRGGTLAVARCGIVFSCIRRICALVIYSLHCAVSQI